MATTRNNTTKKAPAAKTAPKTAAKPAPEKKTAAAPVPDEKDSEIEALKKQVEDMKALLETAARPQIVQIGGDAEKVSFLWQAEVADDNVVVFGDGGMYGRIVGKTGTFSVPKSDLSRLLDGMNRFFLDKRWLIALDGLTEEELRSTLVIEDRAAAIQTACTLAQAGDVVLVAGKGHEDYQIIKGVKYHFDDHEVVKKYV